MGATEISNGTNYLSDINKFEISQNFIFRNYSLLADRNQVDGWPLEFLPNLTILRLYDVSQRLFQSISCFCPNLKKLHVFASDITDTGTVHVFNLLTKRISDLNKVSTGFLNRVSK